jgi:hypothetical protein
MKRSSPVEATILFAGTLYQNPEVFLLAKEELKGFFGEIAIESPDLEWKNSEYYRDELGWPITRTFLFFRDRIDPLRLPEIKQTTDEIEERLSTGGKRKINIDPGYMTLSKVVLASTKNYSHRLYIGKGIFAELTLVNTKGRYRPHLFTYRDYASEACIEIFGKARELLKARS